MLLLQVDDLHSPKFAVHEAIRRPADGHSCLPVGLLGLDEAGTGWSDLQIDGGLGQVFPSDALAVGGVDEHIGLAECVFGVFEVVRFAVAVEGELAGVGVLADEGEEVEVDLQTVGGLLADRTPPALPVLLAVPVGQQEALEVERLVVAGAQLRPHWDPHLAFVVLALQTHPQSLHLALPSPAAQVLPQPLLALLHPQSLHPRLHCLGSGGLDQQHHQEVRGFVRSVFFVEDYAGDVLVVAEEVPVQPELLLAPVLLGGVGSEGLAAPQELVPEFEGVVFGPGEGVSAWEGEYLWSGESRTHRSSTSYPSGTRCSGT